MRILKIEEVTDVIDIDLIVELEKNCFGEMAWSKELLISTIIGQFKHVYILKDNEKILGYLILQIILDEGEIERIGIHSDYRRQSFAKYLLIDVLKETAITDCYLEVNENNEPAKYLYHSCGFEIIGRRSGYYQDGNDAIMMKWKRNCNE